MRALKWWMRIVGAFFLIGFLLFLPPLQRTGFNSTPGVDFTQSTPEVQAIIAAWFTVGIIEGVLGVSLILGARDPERNRSLARLAIAVLLVAVVPVTYDLFVGIIGLWGYVGETVFSVALAATGWVFYRGLRG